MKKYSYTPLALTALSCIPLLLAGCVTPPGYMPSASSPELAGPMVLIAPAAGDGTKDLKKSTIKEDDQLKISSGSGVFVKPVAPSAAPQGNKDIVLNFEGADLREVVRVVMGDMLQENYTIDPKVNGSVTIHTSQAVSKAAVPGILETVLRMNGAAMVRENGVYKIGPVGNALRGSSTPQMGGQPGYGVQIVPLQYIAAREMAKILEPLVPEGSILRVDETRNLLMLSGGEGELRHALETVNVFDVDWLSGMSVGLFTLKSVDVKTVMPEIELLFGDKSKGPFGGLLRVIPMERMNALLVVSPRPQYLEQAKAWVERLDRNGGKAGTRLHVYPVQNGNAEKIAALLSQVIGDKSASSSSNQPTVAPGLSAVSVQSGSTSGQNSSSLTGTGSGSGAGSQPSGTLGASPTGSGPGVVATGSGEAFGLGAGSSIKVIADRDNNALLIMANGAEYEKIEEAIKRLDVVPRQVLVEVTIAEVTLSGDLTYGLEWFFSSGNVSGSLSSIKRPAAAALTPSGPATPILPFSAIWRRGGDIKAVLSALSKTTNVNVLSSPHIMVTDNQIAKINVGSSVPVAGQSTVVAGNGNTPATAITSSVNYVDTGVVLSVRPHINAGGLVTLEVSQEVSDVQDGITTVGVNSPTINKRSAQTILSVQSGDTMVLGGLIKDDKQNGSSGLPLLSDIPVVGGLFGTKTELSTRRELIITITPRVVNDYQQARDVTEEFRKKLTGMQKLRVVSESTTKITDENANPFESVRPLPR